MSGPDLSPRTPFLALLILAGGINAARAQDTLTLTVVVTGATAETGQAMSSLFSSEETYMAVPAQQRIVPIDSLGQATWTFEDLKPGWYAVAAIYDEDMDGELDTGLFGIPKELIGMSNNAKGRFGPAKWEKTRFELTESRTIEIRFGKAVD